MFKWKETGKMWAENLPLYNPFFFWDSPTTGEITLIAFLKKAMSIPGFEPGLLWQNAVALPLAPPSLPYACKKFV